MWLQLMSFRPTFLSTPPGRGAPSPSLSSTSCLAVVLLCAMHDQRQQILTSASDQSCWNPIKTVLITWFRPFKCVVPGLQQTIGSADYSTSCLIHKLSKIFSFCSRGWKKPDNVHIQGAEMREYFLRTYSGMFICSISYPISLWLFQVVAKPDATKDKQLLTASNCYFINTFLAFFLQFHNICKKINC